MSSANPFHGYAQIVCEQIRWKKAHPAVMQEIENHLADQRDAYMAEGDPQSVAEEKALLQMGDPVTVGMGLDHTHKPAPQWGMIALVLGLFAAGLCLQILISRQFPAEIYHTASIPRAIAWSAIALVAFIAAYFLDFSFFGKHPALLPLLLLVIDFLAQMYGAEAIGRKWLSVGVFSISPVALAVLFPLAFCGIFYCLRKKGRYGYLLGGLAAAFFCMQLILCHSFAGLLLFVCTAGILMIVATAKNWFGANTKPLLLAFIAACIGLFALLIVAAPYRFTRVDAVLTVFHPETDPTGVGYMPLLLRDMLESSAFLGKGATLPRAEGLGNAFLYDYLLTFLTYHYGWAVSVGLVVLLAVFLGLGFRKCLKQKSLLGQMVSLTILCTFGAEILIYIIVNLGYPIMAPIALPFLSYGGTSLLLNMALAGILLSVFRTGEVYRDDPAPAAAPSKFIQWDDGRLIISFKN